MAGWSSGRSRKGRNARVLSRLRTGVRTRTAQAVTFSLVFAGAFVPAAAVAATPTAPPKPHTSKVASVPVAPVKAHRVTLNDHTTGNQWKPTATTWPTAGAATAQLAPTGSTGTAAAKGTGRARAGTLPVWVAPAKGKRSKGATVSPAAPGKVAVQVLGQDAAHDAGVQGLLLKATPTEGGGSATVSVDYSAFKDAYGGDWAQRLRLVELPACALTTPDVAACRVQTPLPAAANDQATDQVSAQVALPAAESTSTPASPAAKGAASPTGSTAVVQAAAVTSAAVASPGAAVVLAATAATSGGTGDYSATSLKPSGSWTAGGSSGDFTYAYPINTPPSAGGLDPDVSLGYDSQSVDGETASTENQSSWLGDGWDYSPGAVVRSYTSCSDDAAGTAPKVGDDCWDGQILQVSFDGHSGSIVQDSSTPTGWKLSDDQGEVVQQVTGGTNGTYDGDYWKITTTDGTSYYFGLNRLPGWATGDATTNSAWTVPVYGAHSGDPCYNATFSKASCAQAYQWNLDYVTDVHGNAEAYYYDTETNYYGADNATTGVSYIRGGYLDHIDYGFTAGNAYTAKAPQQVEFTVSDRCTASTCDPIASHTSSWPDVPYDLDCDSGKSCSNHSPSFWTEKRLTKITSSIYQGGTYAPVDTYALTQTFPSPGDGTTPSMWLSSITHTGDEGTAITSPPVTFAGAQMANRYDTSDGYPDLDHYRITGITTETGDQISVTYSSPSCTEPSDPSTNTSLCYPVYWTPPGQPAPILDWFNKYLVTSVTDNDTTGGEPATVTSYAYVGNPAWHYDDNEVVKAKYRTWGQWRGYPQVQTRTGDTADGQTLSDTVYYQGMDGDTLPGGKTRSADVTLSSDATVPGAKTSVPDSPQLAGRVRESLTYTKSGGTVNTATVTDYWVGPATATRTRSGLPDLTANMVQQAASYSTTAITSASPTTWRSTETDYGYDPKTGLLLYTDDHGDTSQPAQEQCTSLTYAPANATENLVGLVSETETDQGPCATGNSGSTDGLGRPTAVTRPDDVVSDVRTFYDTAAPASWPPTVPAFPQTTTPTQGNPTLVEKASGYSSGAFTYQITSASLFDSYARVVGLWDAEGNETKTQYTTTAGLTSQVKVTDPLGHSSTTTVDPMRAAATKVIGPNGEETDSTYDALGRITATWLPGHPESSNASTPDYKFSYLASATAPSAVTTSQLMDNGTYSTDVEIYDALLRARQTQTSTPAGGRLLTDTFYDSHGWVVQKNQSYADGTTLPTTTLDTATTDNLVPNADFYTYDGMGRQVLDVSKELNEPVSQTQTVYGGDRTTVIPPTGGTITTTRTDARGRTTEVDDYLNAPTVSGDQVTGGTYTSSLTTYDQPGSHGEATVLTDPNGNQRTSTYNLLGEETSRTDPDTGLSSSTYDANGNLHTSTDANGQEVSYTYDAENRKTGEYLGAGTGDPIATWTYDDPKIADSIGQETSSTSYDSKGNAYTTSVTGFTVTGQPTGTTITVPSSATGLSGTYTYSYGYTPTDSLPQSTSYPAAGSLPAEKVTTAYNGSDLPVSVGGTNSYTSSTTYDAYSRVQSTTLGLRAASAVLGYSYDEHTGDLTEVDATRTTAPTTVDDLKYTYDPSGNVTSTVDSQNGGSTVDQQCYQYNGLDRLTQAWTTTGECANAPSTVGPDPTVGGPDPYWTEWSFDADGNRKTETQHPTDGTTTGVTETDYHYGKNGDASQQPDTLTSLTTTLPDGTQTSAAYTFDADGNTQTSTNTAGSDTMTWDADDKLTQLQMSGQDGAASYVYDADGNLLLQTDPDGTETLHLPGQDVVYTPSTGAVSGDRYIALPDGSTCVRYAAGNGYVFQTQNQLGTSSMALDSTAQTATFRSYDPYGNQRGAAPTQWYGDKGFDGGTQDQATGLTNLGAREYDPTLGRFISADPILEADDPNQVGGYAYAADNPITQSDPSGLMPRPLPIGDGDGDGSLACGDPGFIGPCPVAATSSGTSSADDHGGSTNTSSEGSAHHSGGGCAWYNAGCWASTGVHAVWNHKAVILGTAVTWTGSTMCMDATAATDETVVGGIAAAVGCNMLAGAAGNATQNALNPHGDHSTDGDLKAAATGAVVGGLAAGMTATLGSALISTFGEDSLPGIVGKVVGGTGSCNSFTASTTVLLANGTKLAISSVKVGQSVLATDPLNGTTKPEPVTATIVTTTDTAFTDLTVHTATGDTTITSTQHHPYWDTTRHLWLNAATLHPGDHLHTPTGTPATVTHVRSYTAHLVTYNLTVNQLHTYYVLARVAPVLVHNCGPTNFLDGSDQLNSSIPKTTGAPGFHDVWIHGAPNGVAPSFNAAEGGAGLIDHRLLARMIKNDSNYSGGPIRLCSCQTGSSSGTFAQDLANKMGVDVMAPTGYLYVYRNGRMSIGADGAPLGPPYTGGVWKTFRPGGE